MIEANLLETLIDQYKVEAYLGEKQFTDVYLAYDVDDNHLVWLDIVRPEFAGDRNFTARFISRGKAIAQVRHPNIARVYHVGTTADGTPYVTQAYIDGLPLSQRLEQLSQRNTPVNSIYALKLVRQLADALLLAERLDLLHYDLQPANVRLKNVALPTEESVFLVDLFVPHENRPGRMKNTFSDAPEYLSPEQRAGRTITTSSHVYSLGVILYQLLAGHLPARPVTLGDTLAQRLLGQGTALERARPGLAPSTYDVVDRSLRVDAGQRFREMDDFIAALDEALLAEENMVGAMVGGPAKERRLSGALILPLLIVMLLLLVGLLTLRQYGAWAGQANGLAGTIPAPTAELAGVVPPVASPTLGSEVMTEVSPNSAGFFDPPTTLTSLPVTAAVESSLTPEPKATPLPTEPLSMMPTLTPVPTQTPSPSLTPQPFVQVAFNAVNLRRGPGVVFPAVGVLSMGEQLIILARNNDAANPWMLVETPDGLVGWISSTVVEMDGPVDLTVIPVAVTIPLPPTATSTPSPSPTSPSIEPTATPTPLTGGGNGSEPTPEPPPPPAEPTLTPPPLP